MLDFTSSEVPQIDPSFTLQSKSKTEDFEQGLCERPRPEHWMWHMQMLIKLRRRRGERKLHSKSKYDVRRAKREGKG
jgi:hypothetical protein